MHHDEMTLMLFGTIAVVLVIASSIGWLLKRKVKFQPHTVIDNLNARINAWWVMLAVLIFAIVIGQAGIVLLFAGISFFALREFISLLPTRRGDYLALLIAFYVLLPYQYYLIYSNWYGLYSILIPLYAFLLLPISTLKYADTTHFLERNAKIQWGLMLCVFCISHIPALLNLKISNNSGIFDNKWLIIWLILVVQSSDVLQYICGKLFGKRKVAPVLSPSKTLEGLIGGIFLSVLLAVSVRWLTPFSLWESVVMAFTVCIFGFLGGLVMSAIKRDQGIKDWGNLIQGHGGMLDRMDSLCFSAPIYFHLLRYFWN